MFVPPIADVVRPHGETPRMIRCELQFDFASPPAHRINDDFDVVTQLRDEFQQLGFTDTAKLSPGDTGQERAEPAKTGQGGRWHSDEVGNNPREPQ